MINPHELRIGNIIIANGLYEREILTVEQIGERGTLTDDKRVIMFRNRTAGEFIKDCEGIPLTPEWLEKCGFEKQQGRSGIYCIGRIVIACGTGFICYLREEDSETNHYIPNGGLKYFHQLQNLHFALTGEELPVKL